MYLIDSRALSFRFFLLLFFLCWFWLIHLQTENSIMKLYYNSLLVFFSFTVMTDLICAASGIQIAKTRMQCVFVWFLLFQQIDIFQKDKSVHDACTKSVAIIYNWKRRFSFPFQLHKSRAKGIFSHTSIGELVVIEWTCLFKRQPIIRKLVYFCWKDYLHMFDGAEHEFQLNNIYLLGSEFSQSRLSVKKK